MFFTFQRACTAHKLLDVLQTFLKPDHCQSTLEFLNDNLFSSTDSKTFESEGIREEFR